MSSTSDDVKEVLAIRAREHTHKHASTRTRTPSARVPTTHWGVFAVTAQHHRVLR